MFRILAPAGVPVTTKICFVLIACLLLNGCAAVTAVSGAAVDRTISIFQDEEESLAVGLNAAMLAVQRALTALQLTPDLIEYMDDGYMVSFANKKFHGRIQLTRQTPALTTLGAVVRTNIVSRERSVERAIIESVREQAANAKDQDMYLDFSSYEKIYVRPDVDASQVGWFMPGLSYEVSTVSRDGWLKVTLPSGAFAFIQGNISKAE